jgi:hypothetical protein
MASSSTRLQRVQAMKRVVPPTLRTFHLCIPSRHRGDHFRSPSYVALMEPPIRSASTLAPTGQPAQASTGL